MANETRLLYALQGTWCVGQTTRAAHVLYLLLSLHT